MNLTSEAHTKMISMSRDLAIKYRSQVSLLLLISEFPATHLAAKL